MLEGSKPLFHKGTFDFRVKHLIVIGVLALAFVTAFIMRSYPVKYGFYLNEFDPYFDYRATKYIVDHGLNAYWKWQDMMSWYPEGRDVPKTSQSGLHIVSAYLYEIFGAGSSLLDFTILLPVILGSLTTIVVFALVRTLGGTTAGMFSALLFAFTPAIIQRGNLGWFKSEPLGLFFGLLAVYLLISATKHNTPKYAIPKAVLGGLLLGLGNASWGGAAAQYSDQLMIAAAPRHYVEACLEVAAQAGLQLIAIDEENAAVLRACRFAAHQTLPPAAFYSVIWLGMHQSYTWFVRQHHIEQTLLFSHLDLVQAVFIDKLRHQAQAEAPQQAFIAGEIAMLNTLGLSLEEIGLALRCKACAFDVAVYCHVNKHAHLSSQQAAPFALAFGLALRGALEP